MPSAWDLERWLSAQELGLPPKSPEAPQRGSRSRVLPMLLQQDGADGAETGESLETLGPASLAFAAVNKKETLSQEGEGESDT